MKWSGKDGNVQFLSRVWLHQKCAPSLEELLGRPKPLETNSQEDDNTGRHTEISVDTTKVEGHSGGGYKTPDTRRRNKA